MDDPLPLAFSRLSVALDRLEASSLRVQEMERGRALLESELALMRADRQNLAATLDSTSAREQEALRLATAVRADVDRAIFALEKQIEAQQEAATQAETGFADNQASPDSHHEPHTESMRGTG